MYEKCIYEYEYSYIYVRVVYIRVKVDNCVWSDDCSEPKSSRSLPQRQVAIPAKLSLRFQ